MFVQTEVTPNPNSLKFLPGKNVSNSGSFEVTKKEDTDSELVRNLLSINGVTGVFLGKDFLSINKEEDTIWEDIKHIVISLINDFYSTGKEFVIANELFEAKKECIACSTHDTQETNNQTQRIKTSFSPPPFS